METRNETTGECNLVPYWEEFQEKWIRAYWLNKTIGEDVQNDFLVWGARNYKYGIEDDR
jgi:hypothetical protein